MSHSSQHDSRRQEFGAPPSSFGHSDLMTRPTYDPYLDNLKSPLIKDESDGKTLRLRFDVAQYKPEEVTVKTIDNRLLVHAKHEEKTPQRTVFREYNQDILKYALTKLIFEFTRKMAFLSMLHFARTANEPLFLAALIEQSYYKSELSGWETHSAR
ncbi:unnamed protein product [Cylicostephanus goldi]|uniref:SHSP domain-containing protein n=1 Tax=Cylicostephanus goldi TaxID=71465 RepID=A0A3P6U1Z5_CYLGO|nr:unnamed protein product [Cylicostephanus goldi]